jgi:hypothetical protein
VPSTASVGATDGATCQNPNGGTAQPGLTTTDAASGANVNFLLNGSSTDPSGFYFLLTSKPTNADLGSLFATQPGQSEAAADTATNYDPATVFTYKPSDTCQSSAGHNDATTTTDSFSYKAVNNSDPTASNPSQQSPNTTVNISVTEAPLPVESPPG